MISSFEGFHTSTLLLTLPTAVVFHGMGSNLSFIGSIKMRPKRKARSVRLNEVEGDHGTRFGETCRPCLDCAFSVGLSKHAFAVEEC